MQVTAEAEFTNVYLFVSDALRFDYVPEAITNHGNAIKTVSSSGVSCTAFSSLVSGLYPPRHGVWAFSDLVPDSVTTLYDFFPGESPSYMIVTSIVDAIDSAIHTNDAMEFESMMERVEEPFFIFDRELSTHAAYGQDESSHIPAKDKAFETTEEYWKNRGADLDAIRSDYEAGVKKAAENFERRLDTLRDRGVLNDTLIIFTADHGEALGEHGMIGHTNVPLAPEVAYVPTVFYNDAVTARGEVMAHVDLLPTIASLTDNDIPRECSGVDLTQGAPDDRIIFNADSRRGGHVYSAWGANGGHTFSSVPLYVRLARAAERLTTNPGATFHRRRAGTVLSLPLRQNRTFRSPSFNRETANAFCEDVFAQTVSSESRTLGEDAKDRLKALGYAEEDI
jgi:phosphoglycerol transferase MdoB-like AlkP superfamily enzyme